MAEKKSYSRLQFLISFVCFLISSVTIWLIPMASFEGSAVQKGLAYTLGTVFWIGFIVGIVFQIPIIRERKKKRKRKSIPLIWFFSNKIAVGFDIILIFSTIGLLFVFFFQGLNQWFSIFIIFSFIFSLEMHCIFNSENYKYIFISNKREGL